MSEVTFIKGFGHSECQVIQQDNEYVVQDHFAQNKKEFPTDNLIGAILYAQENFAVVNFPQPMTFVETEKA